MAWLEQDEPQNTSYLFSRLRRVEAKDPESVLIPASNSTSTLLKKPPSIDVGEKNHVTLFTAASVAFKPETRA